MRDITITFATLVKALARAKHPAPDGWTISQLAEARGLLEEAVDRIGYNMDDPNFTGFSFHEVGCLEAEVKKIEEKRAKIHQLTEPIRALGLFVGPSIHLSPEGLRIGGQPVGAYNPETQIVLNRKEVESLLRICASAEHYHPNGQAATANLLEFLKTSLGS